MPRTRGEAWQRPYVFELAWTPLIPRAVSPVHSIPSQESVQGGSETAAGRDAIALPTRRRGGTGETAPLITIHFLIYVPSGSVTTLAAIAGRTMREYIDRPEGRELFYRTYDEALSVALASGVRPEKML
jgi:hypothetical protein